MDTFRLGILKLALLIGTVTADKIHRGGCVYVTDSEPCPDPDYIEVYLFTENNAGGQKVTFNENSDDLMKSSFNPKNPNKIIIHGFASSMKLDVLQDIKREYLKMSKDINVWMVNYPKLVSQPLCYLYAVKNIQHVGKCLVQFVNALRRHRSNYIHVIGFSLGGQLTNYIAINLKGDKLDRITGLDPAGPGFITSGKNGRLDPSDAHFVDVIHTNGAIQGYFQTCGDVDFYVNGGVLQPGCFKKVIESMNCNHRRAPIYFAESINSNVGFLAWKCKSHLQATLNGCRKNHDGRILMGEHCPKGNRGVYYVATAREKPFALGNKTEYI